MRCVFSASVDSTSLRIDDFQFCSSRCSSPAERGLCGVGYWIDLFLIPGLVRLANLEYEMRSRQTVVVVNNGERKRRNNKRDE